MDFLEARGLEFVLAERANAQALRFYARQGLRRWAASPALCARGGRR
jgi:hypothetical protein